MTVSGSVSYGVSPANSGVYSPDSLAYPPSASMVASSHVGSDYEVVQPGSNVVIIADAEPHFLAPLSGPPPLRGLPSIATATGNVRSNGLPESLIGGGAFP